MLKDDKIIIGKSGEREISIYPQMANRHGFIAGATGTGKTTTLKVMAEAFSSMGVPVFLADVKGDLAGLAGGDKAFPVNIWDVYQKNGIPLRTTISEIGPVLLARILGLNDTQSDVLTVIFKIADDENLLLIDTKDLKEMINYVKEKSKEYSLKYGNLASQSLAAIMRAVVALEAEGAELFFGETALSITDWLCTDCSGRGMIQLLDCRKLSMNSRMYSMFLLWLLSELFELLPEVGDLPKPKMVFFFDEAHMLFSQASKTLLEKVEQVVKLIRSKGVGIYFITQSPKDIPDGVLSQLGNKIQHALHAYTPAEQKGLKAAAQGFRTNPEFDTYTVLQELGVGEALVSVLGEDGVPTVVERTKILMPESLAGVLPEDKRNSLIASSLLFAKYSNYVDNDSAYEFLTRRTAKIQEDILREKEQLELEKERAKQEKERNKQIKSVAGSLVKTTGGTVGREVGKSIGGSFGGKFGKLLGGNIGAAIGRGILGSFFKK